MGVGVEMAPDEDEGEGVVVVVVEVAGEAPVVELGETVLLITAAVFTMASATIV